MNAPLASLWKRVILHYKKLVAATGFLSLLSLPGSRRLFAAESATTAPLTGGEYFPLVGLLLALLLGLLSRLLGLLTPQLVEAALLVVALTVLTGGLHLDGLMDSCDGLFGGRTRERQLEIMRDSRVGSFGVLAGACALLLKWACLASLSKNAILPILCVTLPSARWTLVLVLRVFPGARPGGIGASFRQDITQQKLALACVLALTIVLLSERLAGLLVWSIATGTALGLGTWITRRLGGLTGDTCGAIAEIAEIVGLLTFVFLHL